MMSQRKTLAVVGGIIAVSGGLGAAFGLLDMARLKYKLRAELWEGIATRSLEELIKHVDIEVLDTVMDRATFDQLVKDMES